MKFTTKALLAASLISTATLFTVGCDEATKNEVKEYAMDKSLDYLDKAIAKQLDEMLKAGTITQAEYDAMVKDAATNRTKMKDFIDKLYKTHQAKQEAKKTEATTTTATTTTTEAAGKAPKKAPKQQKK